MAEVMLVTALSKFAVLFEHQYLPPPLFANDQSQRQSSANSMD